MKQFFKHIILFAAAFTIFLCCALLIVSSLIENKDFENYETDSNLLVMGEGESYDLLFLGISHARNFSRHKNHLIVEETLDKKILNLGQGSGNCGVNEQLFYLDYFYHLNNTTESVVIVLSPPLMYSPTLPIASNTFYAEPFRFSFLWRYFFFESENKDERIRTYLNTKFRPYWYRKKPFSLDGMHDALEALDSTKVQHGQAMAYGFSPLVSARFEKSAEQVEAMIDLALANDSKVILFIPPALFGKWQGHDRVDAFGKTLAEREGVSYYDYSESMLEPRHYFDHHHLNTEGVREFVEEVFLHD